MSTTEKSTRSRLRYHHNAYQFVFAALRYTQDGMDRARSRRCDEDAHITGAELLEGIRQLALKQFGLLTIAVFRQWGVRSTEDFGRIVFELIERGEMRKTDNDRLSDFYDVYDFTEVFDRNYHIDTRKAFRCEDG